MQITQNIKLNINTVGNYTYVSAKQADANSRFLNVRYMNDNEEINIPSGSIVTLRVLKPDGSSCYNEGTVEADGTVTVELDEQVLAVAGLVKADISASKNAEILSTANFIIKVQEVPLGSGIPSTNEFLQLTALIEDLQDLDVVELQTQLDDLQAQVDAMEGSSVPTSVRNAILALFEAGAYAETGLEDEIAVIESWATEVTSLELSAETLSVVQPSTGTITATVVPSSATVTWSSSDTSIATVVGGVVTGVSNGTCNITASAGDLSARCRVTVSGFATLTSISAVYTQSGTVYDTDSLDDLKTDLVVTANYSDSSTETVPSADYVLSGTLSTGTSAITVTYSGLQTTFNVTVTSSLIYNWDFTQSLTDTIQQAVAVTNATQNSSGLSFTATSKYINFGKLYAKNRTYVLDIESILKAQPNKYARLFMFDLSSTTSSNASGYLITGSNQGGDGFYINGAYHGIIVSDTVDPDGSYYSGSVVGFYVDKDGYMSIYKDGVLLGTATLAIPSSYDDNAYPRIGGQATADYLYNTVITGFRIYEGNIY